MPFWLAKPAYSNLLTMYIEIIGPIYDKKWFWGQKIASQLERTLLSEYVPKSTLSLCITDFFLQL
jgi:hypothetical protein